MSEKSVPGVTFFDLEGQFFSDQRGWVANPFRAANHPGVDVHNFHCASLEPGAVRGNHYHPEAIEWLFLFEGDFLLCFESTNESGDRRSGEIKVQGPLFVEIAPPAGHAIKNISQHRVFILACNSAPEGKIETKPCQLLESGVH